ncbi:hypothetical protein VYU27_004063 [Nannochloropsis oceanica]
MLFLNVIVPGSSSSSISGIGNSPAALLADELDLLEGFLGLSPSSSSFPASYSSSSSSSTTFNDKLYPGQILGRHHTQATAAIAAAPAAAAEPTLFGLDFNAPPSTANDPSLPPSLPSILTIKSYDSTRLASQVQWSMRALQPPPSSFPSYLPASSLALPIFDLRICGVPVFSSNCSSSSSSSSSSNWLGVIDSLSPSHAFDSFRAWALRDSPVFSSSSSPSSDLCDVDAADSFICHLPPSHFQEAATISNSSSSSGGGGLLLPSLLFHLRERLFEVGGQEDERGKEEGLLTLPLADLLSSPSEDGNPNRT